MNISTSEQETVINISRDRNEVSIWTSDSTMINKLDKLSANNPDYYQAVDVGKVNGVVVNKEYLISDKSLLSFRGKKVKRQLTDEQRTILKERMSKMRSKA